MKLTSTLDKKKRVTTADNFFSSFTLANKLLNKGLHYIGTLRSNKAQIPFQFLPLRTRDVHSSLFGHSSGINLVSYVTKPNNAVILISSNHDKFQINQVFFYLIF